jgi:hypothetical protein
LQIKAFLLKEQRKKQFKKAGNKMNKTKKKRLTLQIIAAAIIPTLIVMSVLVFVILTTTASSGPGAGKHDNHDNKDTAIEHVMKDTYKGVKQERYFNKKKQPDCSFPEEWIGAEVDEESIKSMGREYRIILPDTAVTEDYRPDRLNIYIKEDRTVTEVRCW